MQREEKFFLKISIIILSSFRSINSNFVIFKSFNVNSKKIYNIDTNVYKSIKLITNVRISKR